MTDTNNGWPGKPGVPLNPEKDGWHWVVSFDAEKTIVFWHGENQGNEGYWDGYPLWIAQDWTYLGLVLLPDEASALQKRADQSALGYAREARRADLFKFLHKRDVAALQDRIAELEAALATARRDAMEEAAKIAEECYRQNGPLSKRGFPERYRAGLAAGAQAIAAAIRAARVGDFSVCLRAAARIAELEAALRSIVVYCDDPYLPYYKDILSKACAALEGGKQ